MLLKPQVSVAAVAICLVLFVGLKTNVLCEAQMNITYRAWKPNSQLSYNFPERELEGVMARPNAAIAFTGGGVRSYLASLGYLAGFQKLGLLDKVRYVSGVSGGSWALMTYGYSSLSQGDDETLLGPVLNPEDITMDKLKAIDPQCLRGMPVNKNFEAILAENLLDPFVKGEDVWFNGVNDVFGKPSGVPSNRVPVPDSSTLDEILARNPLLHENSFVLPRSNRPFIMFGGAYLGPHSLTPFKGKNRTYTALEMTPYYVGEPHVHNITYMSNKGKTLKQLVGGFVETFAFGAEAPTHGLSNANGSLSSKQTKMDRLSPVHQATLASFAPGGVFTELPDILSFHMDPLYNMWSPANPSPSNNIGVFADGGVVENIQLISLLQRKVENIILFFNNNQALNSQFDPKKRPVKTTDMSDDLPTFFGINPDPDSELWDLNRNQVFSDKDFAPVAEGLIKAQLSGNGTLYTTKLTTVANTWYGVEAGFTAQVTFVYLSRTLGWEKLLPADIRKHITPSKDPNNPTNVISKGTFKNFPNISTYTQLHPAAELANLISDMCGWIIAHNAEAFKRALGAH
eukprot:m.20202 g.20202  ORF g.20202 m.20202 type:complete len:571 (+) comp8552_c0_seq2:82-1794(+)